MRHQLITLITCVCLLLVSKVSGQVDSGVEKYILDLVAQSDEAVYDYPEKSLSHAKEAHRLSRELENDSLIALTLNRIGSANWSLGNQIEALKDLQESLQLAETLGYEEIMAKNYGNIGNVYSAVGLDLDAIGYYRLELAIQEKLGNSFRLFAINNNLGKSFLDINFYDSAHHYLDNAENFLDSSYIQLHSIFYFNRAETFFEEQDLAKADSLLQLTLMNAEEFGSKRGIIRSNQLMAELERRAGNFEKALGHAKMASELADESNVKELIYICHKTLSNCYADLKNFQNAFKHQQIHEAYLDSVQNIATVNELELLNYYQRLFRLRVLEEKNILSQQLVKQREIVIYGLAGVLLFALFTISLIIKRGRKIDLQAKNLEELNAFKTKIFAIVSHDLKSPIQAVSSSIEMFQEKLLSREEIEAHLPEIKNKTTRLLDLLNNIFQWAEGQLEEVEVVKESFPLSQMIDELEDELHDRLTAKNIQLEGDLAPSLELHSNPGIIRIVLRNLLVNAIKYSHRESKIVLKAFESSDCKIIEVSDQGVGMDAHMLEGIFSMEVGSSDGTDGEKGNGLGLALCYDFVRRLGGNIEVESKKDVGSTFRVCLNDQVASQPPA